MRSRGLTICSMLLILFAAPQIAQAQEAEPDTVGAVRLDPVVVTALRTPFVMTKAPYAIAVNDYTDIRRARPGLGLDEALGGIPGVQVDNRYNYAVGERISIRGFGARAQFGVRGIKVLMDGIPATFPDGQTALNNIDLSSVGYVEVIRGPASALYGNAAGGVIHLHTEPPASTPLGQRFSAVAGENGLLRLQSTTSGRMGRHSYLVNVARLTYDGYRSFSAAENLHGNARIGFEGSKNAWSVVANVVQYDAQNPGSLSDSLLRADRSQAFRNNELQRTGEDGRQVQVGGNWRHKIDSGELELSTYALTRRIENPIPPTIIDLDRTVGGLRALFRSRPLGVGETWQWTVGVDGDIQLDGRKNYTNERGERSTLVLNQDERVESVGGFAQVSKEVGSRLHVLGGLRYDYLRFSVDDGLIEGANPDDSGDRVMDAVSPSLGLTYSANQAVNVYANVATAFETPTTTELANRPTGAGGFNPELEPQRTLSFEAGSKGQISGSVVYQISAYRAGIENALIPFEVPDMSGRQFFRNAGSAVHQGFEAGASWVLFDGVRTRLGYAYTDARFDEYSVEGIAYDGNEIPGITPHRLEVGLSYETRRGWFAALDSRYLSDMAVNDANEDFSPAYFVMDLRAGVDDLRIGTTSVSAFAGVSNLLNEQYNTSVVVNAFGGRYFEPGPGRALYVGATLSLGWLDNDRQM